VAGVPAPPHPRLAHPRATGLLGLLAFAASVSFLAWRPEARSERLALGDSEELWQRHRRGRFRVLRASSCEGRGLVRLADSAECTAAAAAFGLLEDSGAQVTFDRHKGCYYDVAARGGADAATVTRSRSLLCALRPGASALSARPIVPAAPQAPIPAFVPPSKKALSCLRWYRPGCYMARDKETCLASRDGRGIVAMNGRRIHGQPCVWCGGGSCAWDDPSPCQPFDWVVKSISFNYTLARTSFQVASCPEGAKVPSLWCFALMMPFGYELPLMREQLRRGAGLFGCDEFVVFSNRTLMLNSPGPGQKRILSLPIHSNLRADYGGRWGTALNTDIFVEVWNSVSLLGRYQFHDWTVKTDPDSVFFPERLRELLGRWPMNSIPAPGKHSMQAACGRCGLKGRRHETCTSRVQLLQAQGSTCRDALKQAAEPPPRDCGCSCGDLACNVTASAMYLNNCRFGLHGPIEVLSREAVATYISGADRCEAIQEKPFGEDEYLRRCLDKLGVRRVDEFSLLNEQACGVLPVICTSAHVAFHPFKSTGGYFGCWAAAEASGRWPDEGGGERAEKAYAH